MVGAHRQHHMRLAALHQGDQQQGRADAPRHQFGALHQHIILAIALAVARDGPVITLAVIVPVRHRLDAVVDRAAHRLQQRHALRRQLHRRHHAMRGAVARIAAAIILVTVRNTRQAAGGAPFRGAGRNGCRAEKCHHACQRTNDPAHAHSPTSYVPPHGPFSGSRYQLFFT